MSYKKSSGFIFLTSYTQSIFESNGGKKSNSIVIPHGVNIQPVKFTKKPSKNLLVGYVSPIDTYKNHLNVVRAVSLYNQKSADNIVLHLVGAAGIGYKNVYKLVKANNMEKYVIFHGQLSHNKTIEFQNKMDIIIFASSCENFPITLLETMMLKKPLLCSDIRPMPDILGKNAIYFDPNDINSIYKSFLLSQNKDLLKKNAEGAFNIALNYNWENVSKRTFEYLYNF
jgi:glycosyltransferase involved in cell wall biosynthesis